MPEYIVKASQLADLLELSIQQVQRACFRVRSIGIIAELPKTLDVEVTVVADDGLAAFEVLESTQNSTPGQEITTQETTGQAVVTENVTRSTTTNQFQRTVEGGIEQETTVTTNDYQTVE
jgi:hypothetical protein